jgi:hypothetical protein
MKTIITLLFAFAISINLNAQLQSNYDVTVNLFLNRDTTYRLDSIIYTDYKDLPFEIKLNEKSMKTHFVKFQYLKSSNKQTYIVLEFVCSYMYKKNKYIKECDTSICDLNGYELEGGGFISGEGCQHKHKIPRH